MEAAHLFETFDALVARRDDDINGNGRTSTSPSLGRATPHEHERLLVALVLLSSSPQEQLDQVWEKYGSIFTSFTSIFSMNCSCEMEILVDDRDVSQNDFKNFLLCAYCTRLVAQVTARLTTPPSEQLQRAIFESWTKICTIQGARAVTKSLSAMEKAKIHSTVIALCVDMYNALIAWTSRNIPSFSVNLDLRELWNVPTTAYTEMKKINKVLGQEERDKEQKGNSSIEVQSKLESNEAEMMLNILDSVLGSTSHNIQESDDPYTIGNMQRLLFVLFELQGPESVSDELVRTVLVWIKNSPDEISDQRLRVLWDGWILKNIEERISKKQNNTSLLRDPDFLSTIQQIIVAHVVSPTTNTLRPLAWQSLSQITKSFGWECFQKLSKSSLCTWCRLACGEWKIQLEAEPSERQKNLSILDGCGNVIINIVQYLVDFAEHPNKSVPLTTESLLSIRQELEETLSLTSGYLLHFTSGKGDDDIESAMLINLWTALFSEIHISTSHEASNIMLCFQNLLQVSDDESLIHALLHVLSTISCEDEKVRYEYECVAGDVTSSIVLYLIRSWENIAKSDSKKFYDDDFIHSACVATEILAEYNPPNIHELVQGIFEARNTVLHSFHNVDARCQRQIESKILRPLLKICDFLFKRYQSVLPKNASVNISTAKALLRK